MDEAIQLLNHRYILTRRRYLKQEPGGAYHTVTDRCLTDNQLKKHLAGAYTLGVFHGQKSGQSKYLLFDIDVSSGDAVIMEAVTAALIRHLIELGIPEGAIGVCYSGSKGFHVTVFFAEPTPARAMLKFGKPVQRAFSAEECQVELRPESVYGGKGVKLPGGKHQQTGRWCTFRCPHHLSQPLDLVTALESIEPMEKEAFLQLVEDMPETKAEPKAKPGRPGAEGPVQAETDRSYLEGLYRRGLPSVGTRYRLSWRVALWLRERGYDTPEGLYDELLRWSLKQHRAGKTRASEGEIRAHSEQMVRYIFDNNCRLRARRVAQVEVPASAADLLMRVVHSDSARRVALALLMQALRFGQEFFYGFYDILRDTELTNKREVHRAIECLVSMDVIEIFQRGTWQTQEATLYRLKAGVPEGDIVHTTITATTRDVAAVILSRYPPAEVRKALPRYQAKRIIEAGDDEDHRRPSSLDPGA